MKRKHIFYSILGACLLAVSANSSAIPVTIMIGDNDGYGFGVADGADLPSTIFDNRSAAELAATDGSQNTDFAEVSVVNFTFDFDATAYSSISNVFFTMDVSGIQQSTFGTSTLLLDGVDVSAGLPIDQGALGSGIFSFGVNAADLLDGQLDVSFTGGSSAIDFIAFDYFALDFDSAAVPEPSILTLLGLSLALFGFNSRRRKAA